MPLAAHVRLPRAEAVGWFAQCTSLFLPEQKVRVLSAFLLKVPRTAYKAAYMAHPFGAAARRLLIFVDDGGRCP
jgi:hypothetical protein